MTIFNAPPPGLKRPFYQDVWFIVACFFCCWPLGVVLVWLSPEISRSTKIVTTVVVVLLLVLGFIARGLTG